MGKLEQGLTVAQGIEQLQAIADKGGADLALVVPHTTVSPRIGRLPSRSVHSMTQGFDWEQGQVHCHMVGEMLTESNEALNQAVKELRKLREFLHWELPRILEDAKLNDAKKLEIVKKRMIAYQEKSRGN